MRKEEILIVEDDLVSASIIKKILASKGFTSCVVVPNSREAIAYTEKSAPDLILMDILLNDNIDGIETAAIIRSKSDIPVIYMTSDSSEETIQRAKITEPFGYLVKPVSEKTLITNIELTLQKQYSLNKKILETLKKMNDELETKVKIRTEELLKKNEQLEKEIIQRRLAEEELKKSERLATIGRMSAILAHEIRNPLNSIRINTDILTEKQEIQEAGQRRLQIIQKEVNRLDTLVKEVLQYSRQTNLVITEFNLFNLIDNIYHQLSGVFKEKNIVFKNDLKSFDVSGDSEKLKQVFLNMIINSIEAITGNGIIEIFEEQDSKEVHIYIKDNGGGIQFPEKIFEPFTTTKSTGTGLGLSISQNIIEQHKGKIKLISSNKGETIFCVSLKK
jgi:signal transduction histidine kinase